MSAQDTPASLDRRSVESRIAIDARRTWSLALLFMAGALNLFDRQIINVLAQAIKTDLGISDAQLGLLTGTAFGIFYSAFGIPLGRLADRVDRVKLIAVALITWSGFTALCGAAGNFLQLFVLRMGIGVGEAGSQPASTALIPDLFPEERRVSATSILLVGGSVGSFLGLLLGGYVGSVWGWRTAFVVAGIPGIILAVIMVATMRDPRSMLGVAGRKHRVSLPKTLKMIASRPKFRGLVAGLTCSALIVYAAGAWLPAFFMRKHGMTMSEIGIYSAVAVGVGGAIGTLGGGILCDRLRKRLHQTEVKSVLLSLALSVPPLLVTVLSDDRSIALASWFVLSVFGFAWQGPTITLIQKAAGEENRAIAVGISGTVAVMLTLGGGLPLIGLVSDMLTPQFGGPAIGYALVLCIVPTALLGMVAHWRVRNIPTQERA